jgi:hypothetical protein
LLEEQTKKGLHFFWKKFGQNLLGQIAKDNLRKLAKDNFGKLLRTIWENLTCPYRQKSQYFKICFLAEPFIDVYENQSLTVEQLRQLTWKELQAFIPPDPSEVGEF